MLKFQKYRFVDFLKRYFSAHALANPPPPYVQQAAAHGIAALEQNVAFAMSTGPHLPVGAADDTESTFSTVPTKCKKFYFIFQRLFEKSKIPGFLIGNDSMKTFL